VPGPDLGSEFVRGIHGGIDVPSQPLLSASQGGDDVLEQCVTDNEQVNVARGPQLPAGGRPEHERHADATAKRGQRLTQEIGQSRCFRKQTLKLRKDWRRPIGLEVDLPPLNGPKHEAGPGQLFQLALDCTQRGTRASDHLTEVERFVRVAEQPAEHPSAGETEQDGRGVGWAGRTRDGRSHNEYKRTHIGNAWQLDRA